MRRGVAVVSHEALLGDGVGPLDPPALGPTLERALPMGKGKASIGARESRIEAKRHLEEVARLFVVGFVEPVHVPEAAVIRLPSVERVRRLQDGAVALERLDLARERGDDAVADLVENK